MSLSLDHWNALPPGTQALNAHLNPAIHTPRLAQPANDTPAADRLERKVEGNLTDQCIGWLNRNEIPYLLIRGPLNRKTRDLPPGWPDLTLIFRFPTVVFIEMKSPTGRIKPDQRDRFAELRALGWNPHICRDYDGFIALILAELPTLAVPENPPPHTTTTHEQ